MSHALSQESLNFLFHGSANHLFGWRRLLQPENRYKVLYLIQKDTANEMIVT